MNINEEQLKRDIAKLEHLLMRKYNKKNFAFEHIIASSYDDILKKIACETTYVEDRIFSEDVYKLVKELERSIVRNVCKFYNTNKDIMIKGFDSFEKIFDDKEYISYLPPFRISSMSEKDFNDLLLSYFSIYGDRVYKIVKKYIDEGRIELSSSMLNSSNGTFIESSCLKNGYINVDKGRRYDILTLAALCHELGHVFGSPDYYDTDYAGSGGEFSGIGKWDLMSSGSWNGNGISPAHHNPYTKIYIYRWATPNLLDTQSTVILNPSSEDSNSFYRINTTTNGEYYLIENRQKIHFDNYLPGHGMIVYHAHKDLNYWDINTNHPQKLYPVCAVTEFQQPNSSPSSYGNVNSDMCPFPGSYNRTTLSDYTTPWIRDWDTNITGIALNYIIEKDNKIYFKINDALPEPFSFTAETKSETNIELNWEKYGNYKVIVRCSKTNDFTSLSDSNYRSGDILANGDTVIYTGSASSFSHINLFSNETYYYNICSKLTDTTYSNGITIIGHTYCNSINNFPYVEEFYDGMPECWWQEPIIGNSTWTAEDSVLVFNNNNNSTRLVLTPFSFSDSVYATIKITLNNYSPTQPDALSIWYKTDNANEWKYLQRYTTNINSEIIAVLHELSSFYLVSLVAETDNGAGISIEKISIDTYSNRRLIVASSADANGTISPNGVNSYTLGDNIIFRLIPNENYEVDSVFVDGNSVNYEENTYEFTSLQANSTIYATFKEKVGITCPHDIDTKISIYPNPAQDIVFIDCDMECEIICNILDMCGRIVSKQILPAGKSHSISIAGLNNGIYIIKLTSDKFDKTQKLIIKR